MMTISNLPRDLVGDIFSRVPLKCLSAVRFTCKTWNNLSKKQILGKKAAKKNQFLEFMIIYSRVCSLSFDLQGILNDHADPSMKHTSTPNNQDEVSQIFHCDGLLLCVIKDDHSRLLVCNPYLGQIKWIQVPRRNEFDTKYNYALGYDKNNRNHKIMRQFPDDENNKGIDVYEFSSESWRVLDVYPEADDINFYLGGVSVKENSYFLGQEITTVDGGHEITNIKDYLLCFDFTTERFGSSLPLPFHPEFPSLQTLTLCWVRDEKLAVLYNHYDTYQIIEIWITTKIEPNAVLWNTFLTVDLGHINGFSYDFVTCFKGRGFFIDEEKKVAVLFGIDIHKATEPCHSQMGLVYIFGEDGYFKSINMGQALNRHCKLVCSSYVPSLVQLKFNQLGKRKERDE